MPQWRQSKEDDSAKRIRMLEDELYITRETIVSLTPEPLRSHLKAYRRCEDENGLYNWQNAAVEITIGIANASAGSERYRLRRVDCPLCGSGGYSYYESGYAVPEGLRRHLEGRGRVQECPVMGTAWKLARSYWNPIFREREIAANVIAEAERVKRRKTEMLYRFSPLAPAVLYEDRMSIYSEFRSLESLSAAEERLKGLGFNINVEENVKSYVRNIFGTTVYADPRPKNSIIFFAFLISLTPKGRVRQSSPHRQFSLPDAWKHDLPAKFEKLVRNALTSLRQGKLA